MLSCIYAGCGPIAETYLLQTSKKRGVNDRAVEIIYVHKLPTQDLTFGGINEIMKVRMTVT